MKRYLSVLFVAVGIIAAGCSQAYKAKPVPFQKPASFKNVVNIGGAEIAARAFVDAAEAESVFGFDIRGAGMLPVQVVFDNQSPHALEINGSQTFLDDGKGNLWPILSNKIAYERATKYAKTKQIFKEGAYTGFLGAAAGSLIGAAVGIVTGEDIAASAGKGAAVGAAAGATMGGVGGYASDEARRSIIKDLREKSLQNNPVSPKSLAHGLIFFPGEAESAKQLRLQIREKDTSRVHVLMFDF